MKSDASESLNLMLIPKSATLTYQVGALDTTMMF